MFNNLPKKVNVVEVGMRDGLQNEQDFVPTKEKIKLINLLSQTGLSQLEITSFVSPKWIPQLRDNQELVKAIEARPGVSYSALVPNLKGLAAAKEVGMKEVGFFLSASESHSLKNINKPVKKAVLGAKEVIKEALEAGMDIRVILSTVFGCPFEGHTDPYQVLGIADTLLEAGAYQVVLADTTGVANPKQVYELMCLAAQEFSLDKFGVHFHDTRGSGLANALAALAGGITSFDSSFGGLGGCPYAPGASGNIATEDLVYMLHSMGIDTGVKLDKFVECSRYAQQLLGRVLPSKYLQTASLPKE
jgi:hydroxymethylglutaryl-CoA lyase